MVNSCISLSKMLCFCGSTETGLTTRPKTCLGAVWKRSGLIALLPRKRAQVHEFNPCEGRAAEQSQLPGWSTYAPVIIYANRGDFAQHGLPIYKKLVVRPSDAAKFCKKKKP